MTSMLEMNANSLIIAKTYLKIPHKNKLSALLSKTFDPLHYVTDPLLPEGLTIIAGRPKIGKTTLIRQLIISTATGGSFLGYPCAKIESLFLCLEESQRLAQRKFRAMVGNACVEGIDIQFEWPRGLDGVSALQIYLNQNPNISLIVIDSLSRFRELQTRNTPQFQQDYETITQLHNLTKQYPKLAIVILHHTTKAKFDDPLDCISGTYGITAAVDGYGVLMKSGEKFRLHWGGRNWDQEISDFELTRNEGRWEMVGEWEMGAVGLTPVQLQIVEILRNEGVVSGAGLGRRLRMERQTASEHLRKLNNLGIIVRRGNDYSLS